MDDDNRFGRETQIKYFTQLTKSYDVTHKKDEQIPFYRRLDEMLILCLNIIVTRIR